MDVKCLSFFLLMYLIYVLCAIEINRLNRLNRLSASKANSDQPKSTKTEAHHSEPTEIMKNSGNLLRW